MHVTCPTHSYSARGAREERARSTHMLHIKYIYNYNHRLSTHIILCHDKCCAWEEHYAPWVRAACARTCAGNYSLDSAGATH